MRAMLRMKRGVARVRGLETGICLSGLSRCSYDQPTISKEVDTHITQKGDSQVPCLTPFETVSVLYSQLSI